LSGVINDDAAVQISKSAVVRELQRRRRLELDPSVDVDLLIFGGVYVHPEGAEVVPVVVEVEVAVPRSRPAGW
jgi:hypothetical protein